LGQYKWHVVRDCNHEPHNASAYHTLTDTFERLQEHGWEYTTTTLTIFTAIAMYRNGESVCEGEGAFPKSPPPYMHHFRKRKEQLVKPESEPETPPPPPKKHKRT
jgi:hypothetical protein